MSENDRPGADWVGAQHYKQQAALLAHQIVAIMEHNLGAVPRSKWYMALERHR